MEGEHGCVQVREAMEKEAQSRQPAAAGPRGRTGRRRPLLALCRWARRSRRRACRRALLSRFFKPCNLVLSLR